MVPLNAIDRLKRNKPPKENARRIFLLYEGNVTEPLFINNLLYESNIVNSTEVKFIALDKTLTDVGSTNPLKMIDLAKDFKKDKSKFHSGYDKVLIIFDLDVFNNDQNKINELLKQRDTDIILCYTNPSIELFLLLTKKNSLNNFIEPNKKQILENNYCGNHKECYIYNLFKKVFKLDSKTSRVSLLAKDFKTAFDQEIYLNHYLDEASKHLTSNVAYIFTKISKNDFNTKYSIKD